MENLKKKIFLLGFATPPKDGSLSYTLSSIPFTSLTIRYSQITQFFCAVKGTESVVKQAHNNK